MGSRPSASENKDENPSKKVTVVRPFTFGVTYPGATVWGGGIDEYVENVTNVKEPAYLIIDDRCINFNGDYEELKSKIKDFEVWYKK